ncbi:DUF3472 domain-containing protein [Ancylomarina euxinus]|uniref:DUF3472 domain-containing protein n=1 Tax=Ancylomarina euxinus TaxID=2283627 RepID=A0A425XX51_9BACT|nr:DUF3472 domain-containing protein [Ancylomarina euxinus]MCZ4696199.1 DUF3472 domain-containing protein [Ancylomarina euxinus]MUP16437.1 DUF3472 domain-containing protein [Ancylomarina euxinus]RRG19226.1 DUF3472 domain-containing protein [Ancylomarina euxinus]
MKITKLGLLTFLSALLFFYSCDKEETLPEDESLKKGKPVTYDLSISVPCEGNSWVVANPAATANLVVTGGIKNWTNSDDKIRTYFYAKTTGTIQVGIRAKFGVSTTLKITLGNENQELTFEKGNAYKDYNVGTFNINQTGYHFIELEGVSNGGSSFGDISDILLGDSSWSSNISFVDAEWFYWGRRGPSVHLNFEEPANKDITWFYNEVTVPVGKDPIGSYFMADGFSSGYFGMQVNSATERRILFSVWSAFDTQDPNQIPAEYTVEPLGYGKGVTVGEFGGEGSGAQSYLVYDWKPGTTYKFLLKGESNADNSIDYTAYFYAPEVGDWKLIASFRRPFPTGKHLTRLHSFLENFNTTMGDETRQVDYTNQWVYDTQGSWSEMTNATFTTDATGSNGARLDYDGGKEGDHFYLRNCGFFSDNETPNTSFTRTANGTAPAIDFSKLEVPSIEAPSIQVIMDRTGWAVVDYSSQEDKDGEGDTGRAADVLDGDDNTYWHSCWSGCTATAPHHITIDMGQTNTVNGFSFTQRQNLSRTVKDLEIQISDDNATWESLGDFVLEKETNQQTIELSTAQTFRYFKFIAKVSHDGTNNAAMAEIATYIVE